MIEAFQRAGPTFLVVLSLVACAQTAGGPRPKTESPVGSQPSPEGQVIIDTGAEPVEVNVEIAETPEEQGRGLMGRTELDADAGMVFLVEQPVATSFWMKDTLIPLSIAFWDERGRIHTILDMEPCRSDPCTSYFPSQPWSGALEVNRGFFADNGVKVGDRARVER
ncbi:MAG: DUF192 domain-containing protein [Actinomycetota bacterium]